MPRCLFSTCRMVLWYVFARVLANRAFVCLLAVDYASGVPQKGVPPNGIMVWWQSAARLHTEDFSDRQDDFPFFAVLSEESMFFFFVTDV